MVTKSSLSYHKKRMLLYLPSTCKQVKWAKMYLYYWYSYKASFSTVKQIPSIAWTLQVHQIKKQWSDTQATSINRQSGRTWTSPFLALDWFNVANYVHNNEITRLNQPVRVCIDFNIIDGLKMFIQRLKILCCFKAVKRDSLDHSWQKNRLTHIVF